MSDAAESQWEYDRLPDECPECGEDVYLAARILETDADGEPEAAEMMCGERYYRAGDVAGIPVEGGERGCGHTWDWMRGCGS